MDRVHEDGVREKKGWCERKEKEKEKKVGVRVAEQ